ncbi:hypothetical protein [Kocuria flava]|uniref:hypothetical protein n=1 Tax=Kocuria flava TaxID=446860 RepID=UPI0015E05582|nr:hypothetical protein [Kocuria flava]
MEDYGPENLQRLVATFAHEDSIDESRLVDHIVDAGVNDLHVTGSTCSWAGGTTP